VANSNYEARAPQQNQARPPNQPPQHTGGRVYVMCREEAKDAPNAMTGTFSIKTQPVDALLDSGAMHSFIFAKLVKTLGPVPTSRPLYYL